MKPKIHIYKRRANNIDFIPFTYSERSSVSSHRIIFFRLPHNFSGSHNKRLLPLLLAERNNNDVLVVVLGNTRRIIERLDYTEEEIKNTVKYLLDGARVVVEPPSCVLLRPLSALSFSFFFLTNRSVVFASVRTNRLVVACCAFRNLFCTFVDRRRALSVLVSTDRPRRSTGSVSHIDCRPFPFRESPAWYVTRTIYVVGTPERDDSLSRRRGPVLCAVMSAAAYHKRRPVSPPPPPLSFSWRYSADTAADYALYRGRSVPCRSASTAGGRSHRCRPSAKTAAAARATTVLRASAEPSLHHHRHHLLAAPDGTAAAVLIYRETCSCGHLPECAK